MQSELKPCYLLMKRGLYYAPDRHGYTGVKARAGRYREVDALGLDGVTAIHEDDAAEFSPACWPDIKEAVLRAEITRLTEALRAAEERGRDAVMSAYCTGATDVHNSWVEGTNGGEADFSEAASDYYSSIKGN